MSRSRSRLTGGPSHASHGIPHSLQQFVINDIQLGREIGRGSHSTIVEAQWRESTVAVLEIHSVLDGLSVSELQAYKQKYFQKCEQNIQLSHINIAHVFGIYYSPGAMLPRLVTERFPILTGWLQERSPLFLTSQTKLSIIVQVARGIKYLHSLSPPAVHCDLSSDNILLGADMVPKINCLNADKFLDGRMLVRVPGTRDFMPPEVLSDEPVEYGAEVDLFSFGCVMLHTLSHQWPTPSQPVVTDPVTRQMKARSEVERRQRYFDVMESEKSFQKIQLGVLISVIKTCLSNLPKDRPTIVSLCGYLDHLYVLKCDLQGLYDITKFMTSLCSITP